MFDLYSVPKPDSCVVHMLYALEPISLEAAPHQRLPATAAARISVLMTTHNGTRTIRDSLDSILADRFAGFELVAVDDASEEATPDVLATYAARRMRVLRAERNLVVGARNRGFTACRRDYVGMLCHDDLSDPDRLGARWEFLHANRDIVPVGTEVILAAKNEFRITDDRAGTTPTRVRWQVHVDNPPTWSSVMLRSATVHRLGCFVRPELEFVGDYDRYHWLSSVGDVARADAVLTTYRWHDANTTYRHATTIAANAVKVLSAAYRHWSGGQAKTAARPVIRHIPDRTPPRDPQILERLPEHILAGPLETYEVTTVERAAVATAPLQIWQRVARTAVSGELPRAACVHWARTVLSRGTAWVASDWLESLAVGVLRKDFGHWLPPLLPPQSQRQYGC